LASNNSAAFETDLCVIEIEGQYPRVVMEFKTSITTHDILVYSSKAKKHKQIYPLLRYGLVIERDRNIPERFFTHNEALDFCVALGDVKDNTNKLIQFFKELLDSEIAAADKIAKISSGKTKVSSFSLRAISNERE
jgi:hypothetical protein